MSRWDKEILAPVGRNENLVRIKSCTNLHPIIVLGVHASEALRIAKSGWQIFAQMAIVLWAVLVEVVKVRLVKVFGVKALR